MNRLRSLALVAMVAGALAGMQSAVADAPCLEDLDGNGEVGGDDISVMLLDFGLCPGCDSDLDGDGEVLVSDLSLLLLSFGQCAGPSWATILEWSPDPAVIYDANLRTDIAAAHRPWRVLDNGTGIEMVLIPPGSFSMGCIEGCWSDWAALPVHQVHLTRAFYIGRFEVTQSQWRQSLGANPSQFQPRNGYSYDELRPVESVSWWDSHEFLYLNGMRFLTEAEWEYACRAGTSAALYDGSHDRTNLPALGWVPENSGGTTHSVGQRTPNGFGLFDMLGNVEEHVEDLMLCTYRGYPGDEVRNPSCTDCPADHPDNAVCWDRWHRGGSWQHGHACGDRGGGQVPYSGNSRVGLRAARDP